MPVAYLPDNKPDEQFVEVPYPSWYKCLKFIRRGTGGSLYPNDYNVKYVHIKKIINNLAILGADSPFQSASRCVACEGASSDNLEGW